MERVPNAFELFGDEIIEIELTYDNYSNHVKIITLEEHEYSYRIHSDLISIKFRIKNECYDELLMVFKIIED